jgi:6-phosphogluconolactonase
MMRKRTFNNHKMRLLILILFIYETCTPPPSKRPMTEIPLYVGTYTQKLGHVDGKATGIYSCAFDTITGSLRIVDTVGGLDNPSYLTLSPDGRVLYAVGENGGKPNKPFGQVASYRIVDVRHGFLEKNKVEMPSYGIAPCHVSTDRTGKYVFVANYVTGNVVSYRAKQTDGTLSDSVSMCRHAGKEPWAHQVVPSPDNTLLYAVDKGADGIFTYKIGEKGHLAPLKKIPTAKGSGPRHMVFNPKNPNEFAVIMELSNRINLYRLDAQGKAVCVDSTSTLPAGFNEASYCADIHYHPNGRYVYGSNRGHNSIVVMEVGAEGRLTVKGHVPSGGTFPRSFVLTPDGKWMLAANQNSSTVQVYRVDAKTGMITPAGAPANVPTPVCLKFCYDY